MDAARTIDTQVTLPMELYQAIAQRAQKHGHAMSSEIVALLTPWLRSTQQTLLKVRSQSL